jgi:penicillin-binding protein 2
MRGVVAEGTGRQANLPDIEVAGKTGTAQNPHGRDHAWFIAFAPMENPKIAVCVLVENSGFGGAISAPIARELIRYHVQEKKPELPDSVGQKTGRPSAPAGSRDSSAATAETVPVVQPEAAAAGAPATLTESSESEPQTTTEEETE